MSTPAEPSSGAGIRPRTSFPTHLEFGDVLVFLYLLVFVRQDFWIISNNAIGWVLSAAIAVAIAYFYTVTKPFSAKRAGWEFWLLVALPLLLIYLLRAPFPDVSFDVLNYRLVHAERSLRGPLFAPGDFFPTPAPYNPAPDTLTGLFRIVFGYRLGTIVNLLVLIWTGLVVNKILRLFIQRPWLRCASVLLIVLAEQALFEINNYMVDLLTVPLLLEATYLCLQMMNGDGADEDALKRIYPHAALLIGLSIGLKLTNVTVIVPLLIGFAYLGVRNRKRMHLSSLAVSLFALAAPILPFTIYLWRTTGNPVFPLANGIFKSPFWPTGGGWDARWGPSGFWETLVWPIVAVVHPERFSELAVYSGRMSIGFVLALVSLVLVWKHARVRALSLLFLAGSLVWSSAALGYSRYALYLEILAGIVVVVSVSVLLQSRVWFRSAIAAVFLMVLVAQVVLACSYTLRYEWSMRPTLLTNPQAYKQQLKYLLRDRHLQNFLPVDQREKYANIDVWIQSAVKTSGVEVLLNSRASIVSLNYHEFLATRRSRRQLVETLNRTPDARMYSLCFPEDLLITREFIQNSGLEVGEVSETGIPFFSPSNEMRMMLISVSLPRNAEARAQFESSWKKAAFDERDYRAAITIATPVSMMHAGEEATLQLKVKNLGSEVWPSHGDAHGMYQVNIGDRWLDATGSQVVNDLDGRTALREDLGPGNETKLSLKVRAPRTAGQYILEIDMIHEGVTFFYEKGSKTLRMTVTVAP